MRILLALCLAPTFAASNSALAQQAAHLVPGTKVRVTAPSLTAGSADAGSPLIGPILGVAWDTLLLTAELPASWRGQTVRIPVSSVTALEVQRPGHSLPALRGFAVGAVLGAVGNLVTCPVRYSDDENRAYCYAFGTPIFAGLGGALGAIVGPLVWGPHWDRVSLDHVQVGIVPVRTGLGIGATFAF
jgi:hypothetical protein